MGNIQQWEYRSASSHQLTQATQDLSGPLSVVDLGAFDANARTLATRAHGKSIRIATKSVRNRTLLDRALAMPGYQGLMCYSLAEALWLVELGYQDILVAYPTVDRAAITSLASNPRALSEIVLMVDCLEHLELIESCVAGAAGAGEGAAGASGASGVAPVQVALDIDASLRIFSRTANPIHIGVRRSRLYTAHDVEQFVALASQFTSSTIVGAMFYDAQIAGLPDSSFALRTMKKLSRAELSTRRQEVVSVLGATVPGLRLVNAGGTGSITNYEHSDEVTEVTAGSGLYHPSLFDGYRGLGLSPSAFFGLDVVRAPRPNIVTAFAGGYMASGQVAASRQPKPLDSHFALLRNEGVGEVQTPLRVRSASRVPRIGDRVWLRHAKAGEQMERFNETHLYQDGQIVGSAPTYRGEGKNFG